MKSEVMRSRPVVTIIVPVHNEEKRIWNCLEKLSSFSRDNWPDAEIIVSEDGSTDGTVSAVSKFIAEAENSINVILLHSRKRLGKGAGIKKAVEVANGKYTILMDVDLPVPIETMAAAVNRLQKGADVVAGSRLMKTSRRDEPFLRRSLSYGFHVMAWLLLGVASDSQCGFKAVKTDVGKRIFASLSDLGFAYDVELMVRAKDMGVKIEELPISWHYNRNSSMRLGADIMGMLMELIRIFRRRRLSRVNRSIE